MLDFRMAELSRKMDLMEVAMGMVKTKMDARDKLSFKDRYKNRSPKDLLDKSKLLGLSGDRDELASIVREIDAIK